MLAARARIAAGRPGEAARRLESVVARTAPGGFRGARRAAARQLRGIGRRLRPAPGSGETALSERERDVLALILDGCDTAQIAARLHISPHTARVHTSRVLAAHAAPSRRVLASRVAAASGDPARAQRALAELTPRQRAVALEVASGATNLEIAQRLGLSTRTVEKHLTDAMRRWGVTTRVAVVLRAGGLGEEPAAASATLDAE
jgi:DNA-binding CsgD family transcriptional regulator